MTHGYFSEVNLARRVKQERTRRGWSQETMARRMTENGVKMHQSSIAKIETTGPRRRPVTVDEALGFAYSFGVDVTDLLQSPESASDQRIADLEKIVSRQMLDLDLAQMALQKSVDQWEALRRTTDDRPAK